MFHPRNHCCAFLAALIGCGWTLIACAEPIARPFPIRVHADTAPHNPLEGVRAWAAGRDLGTTDAGGQLLATLSGVEGDRVSLAIACPPGHHTDTPERDVPLRRIEGNAGAPGSLDVVVRCEPMRRQVALVVRAEGPAASALPIEVQDRRVGQTDATGVAHVLLEERPGATLRVRVVTSAHPKLEPRDPVQTFRVANEDTVLLFAQAFTEPKPTARRRTQRIAFPTSPAVPAPGRPYRIE